MNHNKDMPICPEHLSKIIKKHLLGARYYDLSSHDILSPVMIDKLHYRIPVGEHLPISSSILIEVDPDTGDIIKESCKSITLETSSSKEDALDIRSLKDADGKFTILQVRCSPNKYLFNHNLYGSSDMHFLVKQTFHKALSLLDRLELYPVELNASEILIDDVDINSMATISNPIEYLSVLETKLDTIMSITKKPNTLYVGNYKHSDYAYRIYDKFTERKSKRKLQHLSAHQIDYMEDKIRIELILHKRELDKLGLTSLQDWMPDKAITTYFNYRKKLRLMKHEEENVLLIEDWKIRNTYIAWKTGSLSIELLIPDEKTRRKYINAIKDALGVDISRPYVITDNPLTNFVLPEDLKLNGINGVDVIVASIESMQIDHAKASELILDSLF